MKFIRVGSIFFGLFLLNGCDSILNYTSTRKMHNSTYLLLKLGANPNNTKMLGSSPVHVAAVGGDLAMVKILIEGGADFRLKTPYNENLLNLVCDDLGMVSYLIELGVDLNNQMISPDGLPMFTPLMCAVTRGSKEGVQLLLAKGANKKIETGVFPSGNRLDALKLAENHKFPEIVALLKDD